jgi:hypothetical protein
LATVREVRALAASDAAKALATIEQRTDRVVRRWIVYLMVLGVVWSGTFWGGYYLAKCSGASQDSGTRTEQR